jgi:nitroreductase / dihydropteridine reductase
MTLIQKLNWRYATKHMTGEVVPAEKLNNILEAIRLSASSMGLQPYKVLVISDVATREELKPAAYNQPQILEASHLLVFAVWDNINQAQIDTYMNLIASERGIPVDALAGFKANIEGVTNRSAEENVNWAARQAYIALGTGLVAAAEEGVDATPMEGFNPVAFDEILGLKEKGLRSVVMLALGYRNVENDHLVNAKKVRRAKEDFFVEI